MLDGAAVLQVGGDAGGPEGMIADFLRQADAVGPAFDYGHGVPGGRYGRLVPPYFILSTAAAPASAASEHVIDGRTPKVISNQSRKLIAALGPTYKVKVKGHEPHEDVNLVILRDPGGTGLYRRPGGGDRYPRLQNFQRYGEQYSLLFGKAAQEA